jgi:ribonuclease Y
MSFFSRLNSFFVKKGKEKKVVQKVGKPEVKKVLPLPQVSQQDLLASKAQAKEIILEAREEAFRLRKKTEEELTQARQKLAQIQYQIQQQKEEIERKNKNIEDKARSLSDRERNLDGRLKNIEKIKQEQLEKLERIATLRKEEAKKLLLEAWEKKLTNEIAIKIKEAEEEVKQTADAKAKEILVEAMQRGATDYVPEYTVSTVKLTDEEMKGRIIGKEGRNIRTFEKITGVDVDLDEEGVIRLSSFDSIRREVARVTLEKLIADGRIQPSRIEEIFAKTKKDTDRIIRESGEDLCHRLKVYNMPSDVVNMLGRFRYRFSYGQNMIAHTLEETKIGVALAWEVGANVNVVRLGCLLHDIGKVITEEEGSHVQIGVDFLKKFNIPRPVLDCVAQHHQDQDFSSPESILVYIADAISGSRPGARYEDYEEYVARMKNLEEIAKSFDGVEQAYAIQAGREIRVIVNPTKRDDNSAIKLASDIRDKIKKEITVPGQVKVTVIRELRQTEVA